MSLNYSHLPQWLEKNWIFRRIFLFRKLFLTKRKKAYYGQEAEDVAVRRQFPKHYRGTFVDVGCFHPVKYNNTYALYKRGWRGINIDIDDIKIEGFNWLRPRDTNVAKAVSDRSGTLRYWSTGFYSLMNTLDEETAKSRKNCREKMVQADTLTSIIDQSQFRDSSIDFLTIDAEGHDLVVLQSLDFDRYRPYVVLVETYANQLEAVLELDIYKYLSERGFSLVSWTGLSLIFRDEAAVKDRWRSWTAAA